MRECLREGLHAVVVSGGAKEEGEVGNRGAVIGGLHRLPGSGGCCSHLVLVRVSSSEDFNCLEGGYTRR
jgi:hypothetical protein